MSNNLDWHGMIVQNKKIIYKFIFFCRFIHLFLMSLKKRTEFAKGKFYAKQKKFKDAKKWFTRFINRNEEKNINLVIKAQYELVKIFDLEQDAIMKFKY